MFQGIPGSAPPTNHSSSDTCHLPFTLLLIHVTSANPIAPITTWPRYHHHHCLTGALLLGCPFRLQAIDLQVVTKNWLRVLYRCFCFEQWFFVVDCTDQLLANQILFQKQLLSLFEPLLTHPPTKAITAITLSEWIITPCPSKNYITLSA